MYRVFWAQLQTPDGGIMPLPPTGVPTEILILLGVLFLLSVALTVWVLKGRTPGGSSRRRSRHRSHRHSKPEVPTTEARAAEDEDDGKGRRRRHRRKRGGDHRPRNPTLAETGGLPPVRPEGQPPSGP
jgi:hypothetical protein